MFGLDVNHFTQVLSRRATAGLKREVIRGHIFHNVQGELDEFGLKIKV